MQRRLATHAAGCGDLSPGVVAASIPIHRRTIPRPRSTAHRTHDGPRRTPNVPATPAMAEAAGSRGDRHDHVHEARGRHSSADRGGRTTVDRLLTMEEAASQLAVSRWTVFRLAKQSQIGASHNLWGSPTSEAGVQTNSSVALLVEPSITCLTWPCSCRCWPVSVHIGRRSHGPETVQSTLLTAQGRPGDLEGW